MKKTEKKTKDKPKFTYKPSKIFWIATFSIILFLSATNPSPLVAAFANGLWGVVFVFDVETRKKRDSGL